MTKAKLGFLVIHGIGRQDRFRDPAPWDVTFSRRLHDGVAQEIGGFGDRVAWKEIFWADLMDARKDRLLDLTRGEIAQGALRKLLIQNFTDAVAYQGRDLMGSIDVYGRIHEKVRDAIGHLEDACAPGAPVILLAHSLGGHIMSNHIYDLQADPEARGSDFRLCRNIAGIFTFGCNIPVLTTHLDWDKVRPIAPPNAGLPAELRPRTWWQNVYTRGDTLGFPLAPAGEAYAALEASGGLSDRRIRAGLFPSVNPLTHGSYWGARDLIRPVAELAGNLLRKLA